MSYDGTNARFEPCGQDSAFFICGVRCDHAKGHDGAHTATCRLHHRTHEWRSLRRPAPTTEETPNGH